MRIPRLLPLLALACYSASAIAAVSVDHDSSADFSKYKTYTWLAGTPAANPLNEKRIHDAIDAQLAAKGLKQVESGGDILVVTHAATKDEQRVSVDQYGYGGPGWRGYHGYQGYGYNATSVNVYNVRVGELLVDIADGQSKQTVWRGEATGTVSDKANTNAARIVKVVTKLFKNFPPRR